MTVGLDRDGGGVGFRVKAVGFEGTFGFLALAIAMTPLYYIKIDGYPIEDGMDAIKQIGNSDVLKFSLFIYLLSIAFFNFFGISVTRAMSASHRMVLDSLRTVAVLSISLLLKNDDGTHWETFHWQQLVGFFFLLLGTAMYNEVVRFPSIFNYDDMEEEEKPRESFVESVRQDSRDVGKSGEGFINEPLLANV